MLLFSNLKQVKDIFNIAASLNTVACPKRQTSVLNGKSTFLRFCWLGWMGWFGVVGVVRVESLNLAEIAQLALILTDRLRWFGRFE